MESESQGFLPHPATMPSPLELSGGERRANSRGTHTDPPTAPNTNTCRHHRRQARRSRAATAGPGPSSTTPSHFEGGNSQNKGTEGYDRVPPPSVGLRGINDLTLVTSDDDASVRQCLCQRNFGLSLRRNSDVISRKSTKMARTLRSMRLKWSEILVMLVLTILAVMTSHTTTAQSPSWEAEPVNTDVTENGRATLRCQIRNLGGSKIAWLKANKNFFVDGDRWQAPTRFNVSRVSVGDIGGYDLTLNGATREDDADYTCQLQSQTLIATAHITVLVKPRILTITRSQTDLSENDSVTFTCLTSDGNPAPTIRWYRQTDQSEEWEELTGAVTTPPTTKFNESRSELIRVLSRSDHKAHIKCTASNSAVTGNPPEHIITLDVKYAPVVTISPSDATGNHLVVVEGRNASLTCHVDSNPYTSSRKWEKDGVQIPEVNYRAVAKEDGGNYTCVATNVIRSTRTWLTLDVQYGPKVKVAAVGLTDNKLYTAEGSRVNLSCTVTANPAVGVLQWKDAFNSVLGWDRNYVINNVRRTHAGSYSCFAESILRPTLEPEMPVQGTQSVELIVQYPPGKANITGPRFVLAGQETVLRCHLSDKGVPEATLEWTQLGDPQNRVISRDPELRFSPAQLDNNADYICKPTNSINDGEPDTFRLVVNEEPTWLPGGELPGRKTVNVTTPGALMVQCQARGRPLPRVRWYHDDTPVNDLDELFTVETEHVALDKYSFLVTSTLYWRGRGRDRLDRLKRTDTGRYQCQFTNEHGEIHSDMVLTVQYMPVLNVTADKVATDMNQSAVLSCSSHAVPMPRFTWYNRTTMLTPSSRVSMGTEIVPGEFPYRATLNITDVTSDDLGEYKCVGVNALGFAEKYIFLTVKTTPDAPTNLQVLSRTWESVELSWTEGFDGGYRPTYFVFYTSARHNNTRVKVIPSYNKFNVTGLYPSLTYTFKVFGENQLGGGDYSANISTVTDAHPIEPPTEVFYHLVKRTLTFRSPSTNYCVRIEIHDGAQWRDYAECAPPSGSVKIRDGIPVSDVRIALCLQRRKEICSEKTKAFPVKPPPDDLSVNTIIIVACVCGTVVLILLSILIFLCIRRHQARKKDYENDLNAQRAAAQANGGTANKKITGIDNPSLDQTDTVDLDDRSRGRVFANDTSRQNNANYVMFDRTRKANNNQQNGPNQANGYPPMNGGPNWNRSNGNLPNDPPPDYREVARDGGNPESEYIAMHNKSRKRQKSDVPDGHDSGYIPDNAKDGPSSGVSTPDPTKPKKLHPFYSSVHFDRLLRHPSQIDGQIWGPSAHVYSITRPNIEHHTFRENPYGYSGWDESRGRCFQPSSYGPELRGSVPSNGSFPGGDFTEATGLGHRPVENYPVLRMADDSPYGFHGAAPPQKPVKKKSNKEAQQTNDMVYSTNNHLKRYATVAVRDARQDLPRTDFIRGTLHDSMRLPSNSKSDQPIRSNIKKQGSFHFGFSETKRPIHGSSYDMFQQFMQRMPSTTYLPEGFSQSDDIYSQSVQHRNNEQHSQCYYDGPNLYDQRQTYGSGPPNEISPQDPHHMQSHQHTGHNSDAVNMHDRVQDELIRQAPKSDSSYEMSMQVSKPGLEVQLEVIHHRTSSSKLKQSTPMEQATQIDDFSSKQQEIIAKKRHLKPVKKTKKPLKKQLPSDPRDAMAQLLKEQKGAESENSDGETASVHNVKPSAVKKILHKKKEKRNVPKVSKRPQNLTEAMKKVNVISANNNDNTVKNLANKISSSTEGLENKSQKKVPNTKVKSLIKQIGAEVPQPSEVRNHPQPQHPTSLSGANDQVYRQSEGNTYGNAFNFGSSQSYQETQSRALTRPCSVCHQITVIDTPDAVEAITNFTLAVVGSTIFKTKKVICQQCQNNNDLVYMRSPSATGNAVPERNTPRRNSQIDWTGRTMMLQIPDPPYESDTDSTIPEYSPGPSRSPVTLNTIPQNPVYGEELPMASIAGSEGLYGVTSLSVDNQENGTSSLYVNYHLASSDLNNPIYYQQNPVDDHERGKKPQIPVPTKRDITKHFVPPPPSVPAPLVPNDIQSNLLARKTRLDTANAEWATTPNNNINTNLNVPSPPSTQPPTPPSVSLIPSRRNPQRNENLPGWQANPQNGNYFTFPDLEVTLTAPTPDPSQYSGEAVFCPQKGLVVPPGVLKQYYGASQSSSSTSSNQPRSEHPSTSATSQDEITSSSATSGTTSTPVTLIL